MFRINDDDDDDVNILELSTLSVGERRDKQFRSMLVSLLVENSVYYYRNI